MCFRVCPECGVGARPVVGPPHNSSTCTYCSLAGPLIFVTAKMATNSTPLTVIGINSGSVTIRASGEGIRRVLITPLGQPGQMSTQLVPPVIDKVLLKAVAKTGKKKDKLFTLRRINTGKVCTCDELKKLIKKQLCDDVIAWEEFDAGYINHKRGERLSVLKCRGSPGGVERN